MEKTWEIREKEIREEIAQRIEDEIEMMMPPVDSEEMASYTTAHWCAAIARGNYLSTCCKCGNSDAKAIERVVLAIQQRHDDGSDFAKQWINHHGLDRCDCDELIEFVRGLNNVNGGQK